MQIFKGTTIFFVDKTGKAPTQEFVYINKLYISLIRQGCFDHNISTEAQCKMLYEYYIYIRPTGYYLSIGLLESGIITILIDSLNLYFACIRERFGMNHWFHVTE